MMTAVVSTTTAAYGEPSPSTEPIVPGSKHVGTNIAATNGDA
jgi:hypothetical protein